ncbi:MAG: glycoside hydrolase, family 3 domain protein [Candidatus Solibacter sp.]|nr:glycoside hydrolase, family 3 domain protein [Candidatus Solibacter sp.]
MKMKRSFSFRLALVPALIAAACLCWAAAKPKSLSSYDPQVKALLAQMTLDEKIGQMTQPEQNEVKDLSEIETLSFGSLLSGGSSDPKEGNSLESWTNLYDRLQQHALKSRLKIPILYGIDAVHGHNNVLNAVIFPHNIGLGCTRNPKLIEQVQRVTAEEIRATGIQWAFGPCVTVPQDIRWGRTYEGFSEDPKLVRELAGPAVRGFQGKDYSDPLGVLACAKHFVGDGGTAYGSTETGLDQGDTRVDEATLRSIHLQGYYTAIEAGVGSIMPSYSSWNGVKVSGSKKLLTDLLKTEMGFEGFLISDYNAIDQITKDYKEATAISINAGMDMVMVPTRYKEFMTDLKALVAENRVPMSRIDDAVTRILRVKFAMGLMDPKRSQLADRSIQKTFGSPEHRAVARQAVRESLVLLKNDKKLLPLSKRSARIHVAGKNADDIGNQCGGWTIDWQGKSGPVTTGGTTILMAIKNTVSKDTKVTFSKTGEGAAGADVGVIVIGETPYAEMKGDRSSLDLAAEDVAAFKAMKSAGIPVVVIVVSGRPLVLGDVVDQAGAVVAAWLPGTEGQGVADVLFGDNKFTGKLSFTWPRSNKGKSDPLYPYGFGLK